MIDKKELLKVHLFKPMDDGQLDRVVEAATVVSLKDREELFRQGDPAHHFFLVVHGNIKLFRRSEEGNEKIVEIIPPSHVFAEAVMFMDKKAYPVNATAVNESVLYRFDNQSYLQLLNESKELCFALFGDLSIRLHELLNEIETISLQNARIRVVQYLTHTVTSGDERSIELQTDKRTIASRLSITPETLSRIFRELVDEGILAISGKSIDILDSGRLDRYGKQQ